MQRRRLQPIDRHSFRIRDKLTSLECIVCRAVSSFAPTIDDNSAPALPTTTTTTTTKRNSGLTCIDVNASGELGATGDESGNIVVWNAQTGATTVAFRNAHLLDVNRLLFFPSGKVLLSASSDFSVKVWDAVAGGANSARCCCSMRALTVALARRQASKQLRCEATSLVCSALRRSIAVATSFRLRATDGERCADARCAPLTPSRSVKLWELSTQQCIRSFRMPNAAPLNDCVTASAPSLALNAADAGALHRASFSLLFLSLFLRLIVAASGSIAAQEHFESGQIGLTASDAGALYLFDLRAAPSDAVVALQPRRAAPLVACALDGSAMYAFAGTDDGTLVTFDLRARCGSGASTASTGREPRVAGASWRRAN